MFLQLLQCSLLFTCLSCVHTHKCTQMHTHTHTQIHIHTFTQTHTHIHKHTQTHIIVGWSRPVRNNRQWSQCGPAWFVHTHAHTHTQTHTNTCTHTQTHTNTHTHTCRLKQTCLQPPAVIAVWPCLICAVPLPFARLSCRCVRVLVSYWLV